MRNSEGRQENKMKNVPNHAFPQKTKKGGKGKAASSSVPMGGIPLVGAVCGMCLGGPIGLLVGVKIGGLAAVGGSILGYSGAQAAQEQRDHRQHVSTIYRPAHLPRTRAGYRRGPAGLKTPVSGVKHQYATATQPDKNMRTQVSSERNRRKPRQQNKSEVKAVGASLAVEEEFNLEDD